MIQKNKILLFIAFSLIMSSCKMQQNVDKFTVSDLNREFIGGFEWSVITEANKNPNILDRVTDFVIYTDTLHKRDVIRNSVATIESHPLQNELGNEIDVLPPSFSNRGYEVLYLLQLKTQEQGESENLSYNFFYFSSWHDADHKPVGFGPAYLGTLVTPLPNETNTELLYSSIIFHTNYLINCETSDMSSCVLQESRPIAERKRNKWRERRLKIFYPEYDITQLDFIFSDNGIRQEMNLKPIPFELKSIIVQGMGVAGDSYLFINADDVVPSGKIIFTPID